MASPLTYVIWIIGYINLNTVRSLLLCYFDDCVFTSS